LPSSSPLHHRLCWPRTLRLATFSPAMSGRRPAPGARAGRDVERQGREPRKGPPGAAAKKNGRAVRAGKAGKDRGREEEASYSYSDAGSYSVEAEASCAESDYQYSESGSQDEHDPLKQADERRKKALAAAADEEGKRLAEAEGEELAIREEKIEKLVADADAERQSKIDEGTRLIEADSKRSLRTVTDEANAERKRKEEDAEAEYDKAVEKANKQKEAARKEAAKKKKEKELQEALLRKKEEERNKVKSRRQTKAPRDASPQCAPEGRRRRVRRVNENGEHVRRKRVVLEERDPERARARNGGQKRRASREVDMESRGGSDSRGRGRRDGRAQQRAPGRERGKGQGRRRDQPTRRAGGGQELERFRRRYPMDDRAFDQLLDAPPDAQAAFLKGFKARREDEDDYSGLIVSFLRSIVRGREEKGRKGRGRERSRERSRSPRMQHRKRDLSPLSAFRDRYPMEPKAFQDLKSAPEEVQKRVMADFKPKREGEKDYTGLVFAFMQSVTRRLSDKERDRDNSPDRRRRNDGSDRSGSPERQRKVDAKEGSPSPEPASEDERKNKDKDATQDKPENDRSSPDKPGEGDQKDDGKDDEVAIASPQGEP